MEDVLDSIECGRLTKEKALFGFKISHGVESHWNFKNEEKKSSFS